MIRLETFPDAAAGAPYCAVTHVGSAQVFWLTPDELRALSQLVAGALDKLDARRPVPAGNQPTPAQVAIARAMRRPRRR
jgi:hypothetical protein